jgi:hypothetical protein
MPVVSLSPTQANKLKVRIKELKWAISPPDLSIKKDLAH